MIFTSSYVQSGRVENLETMELIDSGSDVEEEEIDNDESEGPPPLEDVRDM